MRTATVLAVCLLTAGCGTNTEQRSASGGLTGAGIGALAGGPVGAAIGAAAGGAGGAVAPEGADQAARQALGKEHKTFAGAGGRPASASGSSQRASQAGALRVPPETVKEMQTQLHADNFYDGPIDGIVGPRTRNGLRRYQEREGLTPTGQIDTVTLQRLTGAGEPVSSRTSAGSSLPSQPADQSGVPNPPPQKPPAQ
jgi:peptidoglycan hydrolase-like protein with peptidoglycan-binding domain